MASAFDVSSNIGSEANHDGDRGLHWLKFPEDCYVSEEFPIPNPFSERARESIRSPIINAQNTYEGRNVFIRVYMCRHVWCTNANRYVHMYIWQS